MQREVKNKSYRLTMDQQEFSQFVKEHPEFIEELPKPMRLFALKLAHSNLKATPLEGLG